MHHTDSYESGWTEGCQASLPKAHSVTSSGKSSLTSPQSAEMVLFSSGPYALYPCPALRVLQGGTPTSVSLSVMSLLKALLSLLCVSTLPPGFGPAGSRVSARIFVYVPV